MKFIPKNINAKPMAKTTKKDENQNEQKKTGSGNYEEDIPIDENVVNYRTNKTAGEEGKETALKDNRDDRNPERKD